MQEVVGRSSLGWGSRGRAACGNRVERAALSAHGKDPQDQQGPGKIPVSHVSSMSVFLLKLMMIYWKKEITEQKSSNL